MAQLPSEPETEANALLLLRTQRVQNERTAGTGMEPETKKAKHACRDDVEERNEIVLGTQKEPPSKNHAFQNQSFQYVSHMIELSRKWTNGLPSEDRDIYTEAYEFVRDNAESLAEPEAEEGTNKCFAVEEIDVKGLGKCWEVGGEQIRQPRNKRNQQLRETIKELFLDSPDVSQVRDQFNKLYMWEKRRVPLPLTSNSWSFCFGLREEPTCPASLYRVPRSCEYWLRLRQKKQHERQAEDEWTDWLYVRTREPTSVGPTELALFAGRRFDRNEVIGSYVGYPVWTGPKGKGLPKYDNMPPSLTHILKELRCVYRINRDLQPCLVTPMFNDEDGAFEDALLFGFKFMSRGKCPNVKILPNGLVLANATIKKGEELIGFVASD
jgi:hypothetical protein